MPFKKTPCECIEILRDYKNRLLYEFWKAFVGYKPPSLFGVFFGEYPEEEKLRYAVEEIKNKLREYVDNCPLEISELSIELSKLLDEPIPEKPIELQQHAEKILALGEAFMRDAVEGIYKNVEGLKKHPSPLSPDLNTRHYCWACLNNIEACYTELKDNIEEINSYITPPENIVENIREVTNDMLKQFNIYINECMPYKDEVSAGRFEREFKDACERLEKVREFWFEKAKEGKKEQEEMARQIEIALWDIAEKAENLADAMKIFVDTQWANLCDTLKWKD